jgi:hypothetical protein
MLSRAYPLRQLPQTVYYDSGIGNVASTPAQIVNAIAKRLDTESVQTGSPLVPNIHWDFSEDPQRVQLLRIVTKAEIVKHLKRKCLEWEFAVNKRIGRFKETKGFPAMPHSGRTFDLILNMIVL